jgi:hypothetical protein
MGESYWDESGINARSPICIVAGFFGGANQWKTLERRWTEVLSRVGLQEFHAKDFWARSDAGQMVGQYRGWSSDKASKFLDDLVDVGTSVRVYLLSCAVIVADWENLPEEQRRYVTLGQDLGARIKSERQQALLLSHTFCASNGVFTLRRKILQA